MPLAPGTKLGPYEVVSALGAGGMGEVYRARDMRLGRDVAIKILPKEMSADPVRKQRFEREAKTISGLNHPNICVLYDVGSQDGVDYLVMECVEGETLAKRLEKGPLAMEPLLKYGAQIADALDKAHRSGVVHRDLKPANVMLTAAGVKLLDFGLAKPAAVVSPATLTAVTPANPVTQEGTVVGTCQYMSPEQVEGQEVDGRSDIFSLGAVLYEMVTGKKAFEGKSQLSVASAILEKEPPAISTVKPLTPPALEHVIRKCLAKSSDDRWQSASDLASELRWITESSSQATVTLQTPATFLERLRRRRQLPWALLACFLAATLALAWRQFLVEQTTNPMAVTHVTVTLPANVSLGSPNWPLFALSQDGTKLVFSGRQNQVTQLYARQLDQWEAVPIRGTEGADRPFLSPDGQWVAFTSGRSLKKVAIGGGPAIDLAETDWGGGSWSSNGQIIYTRSYNGGLWMISASGGTPQELTSPDHSKGELAHWWPQILPDGDTVVFTSYSTPIERSKIVVRSLKTGKQKTLIEGGTFGRYLAPGYLAFSKGGTVIVAPFDARQMQLTGSPIPVLEGVGSFPQNGISQFAVSLNGTLAFLPASFVTTEQKLVSVDRTGKAQTVREHIHVHGGMRLSPEGRRIALALDEIEHPPDVWILDLVRGSLSRLTHGPGSNFNPIWARDGRDVLYTSERPIFDIYRKSADGSGAEAAVLTTPNDKYPLSISPDGETLLFSTSDTATQQDIWLTPLAQTKTAKPFLASPFAEANGAISPDGQWVVYQTNESGQPEIYVVGFPDGGNRVQVSNSGGSEPVWSKNGKELFYRSGDKLIAVPVENGKSFTTAAAHVLFESAFIANADFGTTAYDVSPDAQTFYFVQEDTRNGLEIRVNLVLNWPEELKRIAPTTNRK